MGKGHPSPPTPSHSAPWALAASPCPSAGARLEASTEPQEARSPWGQQPPAPQACRVAQCVSKWLDPATPRETRMEGLASASCGLAALELWTWSAERQGRDGLLGAPAGNPKEVRTGRKLNRFLPSPACPSGKSRSSQQSKLWLSLCAGQGEGRVLEFSQLSH